MPEKKLSEIPRPLVELFHKGNSAANGGNMDYAIALFTQVLQKEPGYLECREALRAAQVRKAGQGSGIFKKVLGGATGVAALAKAQISMRNNPLDAIAQAESVLNGDPDNTAAHKILAEAALAADLPATAFLSLDLLKRTHGKEKAVNMQLADALNRIGQADRANAVYMEMTRLFPGDQEVAGAYKDFSARRTMREGGYDSIADGKGSFRDILKDKNQAAALEQENKQVKTADVAANLLVEYTDRLEKEPKNFRLARQIAELHVQKKDFSKALEYYNYIVQASGISDPALEKAITETTIKKFEAKIAALDTQSPDFEAQKAQIEAEKAQFILEDCKRRSEKYPTDLNIKFELGVLLFQANRMQEATQEFQKAQGNGARKVQCLNYIGQCFARRGMNDLAARTFQNAIKEKPSFDEEKKELVFGLGCVLEKMGKSEEAIEQFKSIYEIDIGYQNVAEKIETYYSKQSQGSGT
jgi:tetratricopeptide (TPR) repeat protein